MMKKILAILCLWALALPGVAAAPFPSATQVIQKEGQFAFSDGASYYLFKKNGVFESGPIGQSGRTIEGHWTAQDDRFTIEGQWGWVNGISAIDDFRRMTLRVDLFAVEAKRNIPFFSPNGPKKTYRCYFVVEELVKAPKARVERSSANEQIEAVVFEDMMRREEAASRKYGADVLYFLSLGGSRETAPGRNLMARFSGHQPQVRPASAHHSNGCRLVEFNLGRVQWRNSRAAEVEGTIQEGGLSKAPDPIVSASKIRFHIAWRGKTWAVNRSSVEQAVTF